jgi:DDE superfamily endonuclease
MHHIKINNQPMKKSSMDPLLTLAVQMARVAAFETSKQQALASLIVSEEDDDKKKRLRSLLQQRLQWNTWVEVHKNRPMFRRHLRMTHASFVRLLDKIRPHLPNMNETKGDSRGGYIIPELRLYVAIRYLAGGSYSDICYFCCISKTAFYTCLWQVIHAINKAIVVKFPSTPEECALAAADFEKVSHRGVFKNCVGALDGYLLEIKTPSKKHASNVRSYFSGHYQRNGVNIQAMCDAHCRFTFLGIGGPGVTKDRQAIKESGLAVLVENIPAGYIVIGDCAYQPTEKVISIFGGDLALNKDNDAFNYYASQLRIRIEMAFGLMTRKWGILQRKMMNSLPNVKHIICCIARLHNFVIDERLRTGSASANLRNPTSERLSPMQRAFMTASAFKEHREIISNEYPQWSLTRQDMVKLVKDNNLVRPVKNRLV